MRDLTDHQRALLATCLSIAKERFIEDAIAFREHGHKAIWCAILGGEYEIGPHQCLALAQTFNQQAEETDELMAWAQEEED